MSAMETIVELGFRWAIPVIRGLLKDDNEEIPYIAVLTLGIFRAVEAGGDIAGLLGPTDDEVCLAAVNALIRMGPCEALPEVVRAVAHRGRNTRCLSGETDGLRGAAAEALGKLG